jgi:hypothetical protein
MPNRTTCEADDHTMAITFGSEIAWTQVITRAPSRQTDTGRFDANPATGAEGSGQ